MLLVECLHVQTKFAFPSEFFPIAFSDCSSSLFYQGLKKRKEGLLTIIEDTKEKKFSFIYFHFSGIFSSALFSIELGHFVDRKTMIACFLNIKNLSKEPTRVSRDF